MDYVLFARRAQRDQPELFNRILNELIQLKSEELNKTDQIPDVFELFASVTGFCPVVKSKQRSQVKEITERRLFIAVVLYLYEKLHMNGYTGRVKNNLRGNIASVVGCNEIWISQSIESILMEYEHIDEFQMQVNLIAYCIKQQGKHLA